MPELPEVETVRRGLEPRLCGRTLEAVDILDGRLTAPEHPVAVALELEGETVDSVGRRGKYLLFRLGSGRTLAVHLRMTGWFHHRAPAAPPLAGPAVETPDPPRGTRELASPLPGTARAPSQARDASVTVPGTERPPAHGRDGSVTVPGTERPARAIRDGTLAAEVDGVTHVRAVFELDDGGRLVYADQRRFGTFRLIPAGGLDEYLRPRAGPEPLGPAWTPRALRAAVRGRRAPIKALLLDQLVVAGVGNIYADEALWEARIHPLRPGQAVTAEQARRLHAAVVAVLERGIAAQGASIRDYRGVEGQAGSMQERFNAYDRDGEPCPRCGTPIAKIRVAGRGTHFCPRCTRRPRE
jgi:formamidopyrimidine-DNA glycosylase